MRAKLKPSACKLPSDIATVVTPMIEHPQVELAFFAGSVEIRKRTSKAAGYRIERLPFGSINDSGLGIEAGVIESTKTMSSPRK
ncbi:MAG: acyl-CoA reductase-like NAD-dependent aldehyde dehydrogenase [Verrucomicrobiales bacterium]|jgi:acyl-CoA reductase-like NAD-dependent aldehyde dehydrogenase